MPYDLEDLTNAVIEALWPALDAGVSRSEVMDAVHNALDAWEPKPVEDPDGPVVTP